MERMIKSMEDKYLIPSLDLVQEVFTEHSDAEEGALDEMKGLVDYSDYEALR